MKGDWRTIIRCFILLAIVPLLAGCVTSETAEYRVTTREDSAIVDCVQTYNNISTDAEPDEIDEDLEDLLDLTYGDQALLDSMADGYYIKERELFIREGQIFARIRSLTTGVRTIENARLTEDLIILELKKDRHGYPRLVETDGDAQDQDDLLRISWPKDAKELYWKLQEYEFGDEARKNQPVFLEKLRERLKHRP